MVLDFQIPGRGETSRLSIGPRRRPRNHSHRAFRTVEPTVEVVTRAEFKLFGKVQTTADDSLIDDLIIVARECSEEFTRRAFITQTWVMYLDDMPVTRWLEIPRPELQSGGFIIETFDEDGDATTFAAANYIVSTQRLVGRVTLRKSNSWPTSANTQAAEAMKITFVAGYGNSASDVPKALHHALMKVMLELYKHREDLSCCKGGGELPYTSQKILSKWRIPKL